MRAALGALLYLCLTRIDILADVVLLQTKICCATVGELKQANAIIRRARQFSNRGILYKRIAPPSRTLCISDASFATKKTSYAIEGQIILVTTSPNAIKLNPGSNDIENKSLRAFFTGAAHVLHCSSRKAKRISHSTSHAESLSLNSVLGATDIIAMRFTELFSHVKPTL